MNENLKKLYQEVILKKNNNPSNFKKQETASVVVKAYNQICGDRFTLYFDIENNKIANLSFHGFGCAISKASSSVLTEKLQGKSIEEAKKIIDHFLKSILEEVDESQNIPEDILAFSAAKDFPGRSKCATLSWDEMNLFLEKK